MTDRTDEHATPLPDNSFEAEVAEASLRSVRATPPEVQASTGAEKIVAACAQSITEVHDYTMQVLDGLIVKINALKDRVHAERTSAVTGVENYVALANDTLKAAEKLDELVDRIEDSLQS